MQTDRDRLDEFEQGNAARGHAGEMEAVRARPTEAMTTRRFTAPWRADKIPGGYVVRGVNVRRSRTSTPSRGSSGPDLTKK
jgi:hypothetical protein